MDDLVTKLLVLTDENINSEGLVSYFRELRLSITVGGVDFQNSALKHTSFIQLLVAFLDRQFHVSPPQESSTLIFSIGVQCLVNLMADNDSVRKLFAEQYVDIIINWLSTDGHKQQNYVCAALLNIDFVDGLHSRLEDSHFVSSLTKAAQSDVEFAMFLLQNLIKKHCFTKLYIAAQIEGKLLLLQLLESEIPTGYCDYTEEIVSLCNLFKISSDNIMSIIPTVNSAMALELAAVLQLLAAVSYNQLYIQTLQNDMSLVINCSYLLRGLNECVNQNKNWRDSLREATEVIEDKNFQISNKPFYGVKASLIRLLGNLSYKHKSNQDQVRNSGCLTVILNSCKLDGHNPFIKECAIFTIRNLCDGNTENKNFISDLDFRGSDYSVVEEFGLSLNDGEGSVVNIAEIRRN